MNLTKKILSVLMVAVMMFTVMPISFNAKALVEGDYEYYISDGEATITAYLGDGGDVIIPDTLNGYDVKNIAGFVFFQCDTITNLTISDNVENISSPSIWNCNSLETVTIGKGLNAVADFTFGSCDKLQTITVDDENSSFTDIDGVLFSKDETKIIKYPIGKTENSYVIPDGVTDILFECFSESKNLVTVDIPDSVVLIGTSAFEGCSELKRVNIGSGVTGIDLQAFAYCTSIDNIIIPDSVTHIGNFSFEGCMSLKTINIGKNVREIVYGAFYECGSLTDVYYSGTVENWNTIDIDEENDALINANIFYQTTTDDDKITDGDISPTEPTTDIPPVTAEPIIPTDPIGTPTTDKAEETTAKKEETTTAKKETTTTAPATTLAPSATTSATTEKNEESVVKVKKPAKAKIKKPKSTKKKQVVVTWNKVKNANGYQIAYSTSKKFKKNLTKTKLIKKAKTTKTTLKKLKSGKKYFIRIRAYKTVNGKKVYGAYSKIMTVKVK